MKIQMDDVLWQFSKFSRKLQWKRPGMRDGKITPMAPLPGRQRHSFFVVLGWNRARW
jgi:hypothetical protein